MQDRNEATQIQEPPKTDRSRKSRASTIKIKKLQSQVYDIRPVELLSSKS